MSTLSWNCHGLGDPRTVREVLDMASRKKPDFIFVMETKVGREHAERLRVKLGFQGLFYVDSRGLSGGLALLWKTNDTVSLLSYSRNHVDVVIRIDGFAHWRITGFYGFLDRSDREESWNLLRHLRSRSTLPWVVLGDFNDLFFQYEKRGRFRHPESLLRGFGEALEDCGLGEGTVAWVDEKLDRVVACDEWRGVVEGARVYNILTRRSDHSSLFLDIRPGVGIRVGPRQFRFEMAWLLDEGCREVVEEAWGHGVEDLQTRLERCGMRLQSWGGDRFHKFGEWIASFKKQHMSCRGRLSPQALEDFCRLETELVRLEKQEDVFWRQRVKQHWLRGADANTRFYYRYASARKRKNTILRLKEDLGGWVDGDAMKPVVMNYFNDIFTANPVVNDGANFFASIHTRVTQSHNDWLNRPYDLGEVRDALFAMFSDKAPGPDGINPGFYQKFWDVVGTDVTGFVLESLNTGSLPVGLNESNIVLIPKTQSPELVTDLCPIALSNVVYKVVAKVIANRMKPLLGDIISVSQSAFIPGRLITDNILVAAEVGHFLNRKQLGKVGLGTLKLDMTKAYDRMEWSFLRKMMLALGFQANVGEAQAIKRFLSFYEELSGQTINYHKSNICFSRNTQQADRDMVAAACRLLPVFAYVGDKVRQRIGSWNKKLLSRAGKEVLLKSVAQAMPTFTMSVFLLPDSLCKNLERVMNRFWWRNGMDGGGIHWLAWLGFKDLRVFNIAMLGKQGERFLTNPQSLVAKVYKARYYPNSDFLNASVGNNPSFCWRSIMAAQGLITRNIRRRIGNGNTTLVWGDPWSIGDSEPRIVSDKPPHLGEVKVSGLIDPASSTWDIPLLNELFSPGDVDRISTIPISPAFDDMWYWHGDSKGIYTVKSAYRDLMGTVIVPPSGFSSWNKIWNLKAPPKWKVFLWRAVRGVFPTTMNLFNRRVEVPLACPLCALCSENVLHSLVQCDYSKCVWNVSGLIVQNTVGDDFGAWLQLVLQNVDENQFTSMVAIMYHIWLQRNSAVWEFKVGRPRQVHAMALASLHAWRAATNGPGQQQQSAASSAAAGQSPSALQCSFDAAFSAATRRGAFGLVL
ncbi:PREDICTED: uncharacterized protein LOC109147192 [Ipomoea nil]|uniref:uncharacterized protein LOC109147192 n=1 Tax=Ipomoea nil TaxID=35883 RepID=UPI0009018E96|nr:PREDICTED: uncharacterized protein LOC109147192 [Ipomoea nil]